MIDLPEAVHAMGTRGPRWQSWVESLPRLLRDQFDEWTLRADGPPYHGHCSIVVPVRTDDGVAAVLKAGFPDEESAHEHLALRRWAGAGSARLLRADPHRRTLLLERLQQRNLNELWDIEACEIVAGLYGRLHVPPLPQLRSVAENSTRWSAGLARLPRNAPLPRRLVEQAISLGTDLSTDRAVADTVVHGDLHYANVLAGEREPWLVIDPKPMNGDPHYDLAPMLWNRWDELAGHVRDGVRRRLAALVDAADLDPDRARDWVIVRMMHNAMWELTEEAHPDPDWLTVCVAIAKAVQD